MQANEHPIFIVGLHLQYGWSSIKLTASGQMGSMGLDDVVPHVIWYCTSGNFEITISIHSTEYYPVHSACRSAYEWTPPTIKYNSSEWL